MNITNNETNYKESVKRAAELEKQIPDSLPEGFFFEGGWLMYQPVEKGADGAPLPSLPISTELKIAGCICDKNNENHGRLLQFKDINGRLHYWPMPMELLAGDGKEYRQELLSKGLLMAVGSKPRQLLAMYLQQCQPTARIICVPQVGWYQDSFVLPDETISKDSAERVLLQTASSIVQNYESSGTLEEWQNGIARYCLGNSRLIFAVSAAFASPLLEILAIENGGIHLKGASSTGKTTALKVAASVWGPPSFIQRWRATDNGVEAVAAWHNDTFLPLDEIGQIDPEVLGETAYMLANGSGKNRADRLGNARKRQNWRLIFFSTGEASLASHMRQAGKKVKAGQEIRLIDIPAAVGENGVFENLYDFPDGARFADFLSLNCQKYYGVASREYLRKLVTNKAHFCEVASDFYHGFIQKFTPPNATGQDRRLIMRFALVAAAGELATRMEITGWETECATKASSDCFQAMLREKGGVGFQEEKAALSQVCRFFEQNGECRFSDWSTVNPSKTINRAGFKKMGPDGMEFYVFTQTFRDDICSGFDHRLVEKVLLDKKWLQPGPEGRPTRSERLPGYAKNTRVYHFTSKVLEDEDEDNENN